jgi:lipopolysaccharide export system protein LptA
MTRPNISKIRAFMNHPVAFLFAVTALTLAAAFPAAAEKGDRDKPMNAEADALRYDDAKQSSVFTGNVVITKGSTVLRGARIDISQDPQGYQQAIAIAAPNKLAFYRKKRDGVDEYIEAEGERIEYDSRADVVRFVRQAVVRRFSGATLLDETTGSLIRYDNTTDVFTVDGGVQNTTATNPSGRVRAMLSPRNSTPAGAGAAPGQPGASPQLRVSPALGAGKP